MAANRALLQSDPQTAVELFREFDDWYGEEEATSDPDFREKLIRLWGLSELQAGSLINGIELLESWFDRFPRATHFAAFLRFQLASAYLAEGDVAAARQHWKTFVENYPSLPECALVRWLWAESLLSEARPEEAAEQLKAIVSSAALSESAKALARGALAMVQLAQGNARAALLLLDNQEEHPVGVFWRSLMAPSLAESLLRTDKSKLALQSAHWFNSNENLLMVLEQLNPSGNSYGISVRSRIWGNHWRHQINKAAANIRSMMDAGFGMNALYLLRLQVYARAGTAIEAYHLSRALLLSEQPEHVDIRPNAYRYAIEAGLSLEKWEAAQELTERFLQHYPDSPELPDILFLQARGSASRKQWKVALDSIVTLIDAFPTHSNVHAWKFTCAKWLAQAGMPEQALAKLDRLQPDCPEAWREYLEFERAHCLQQLNRLKAAKSLYGKLLTNSRYPAIAEQAGIALMKIGLGQLDSEGFEKAHGQFLELFPYSGNLPMVDLLLGSFLELENRLNAAIDVYIRVSALKEPESGHARQQLSRLYRGLGDYARLHQHAIAWIREYADSGIPSPDQPWLDCLEYQKNTSQAALRKAHIQTSLEELVQGSSTIPCQPYLDLLKDKWSFYASMIGVEQDRFIDWVAALSAGQFASGSIATWAELALYQADMLMHDGRTDSADAIRIRVLTTARMNELKKDGLYEVAKVAHTYDFPESSGLLGCFLDKYEDSNKVPHCLLMLAREIKKAGQVTEAINLLQRVYADWKDSRVFIESSLLLADWRYQASQLTLARTAIEGLLQRPDLSPRETARSLLIRARIDRADGNPENCRLNCSRILTLYPDIKDISTSARNLMESLEDV